MPGSRSVWFATSNDHKFEEARLVLADSGLALQRLGSKGVEMQADTPQEVAALAASEAFRSAGKPLFVEDTGLYIESLGGFPGVFASYAFKTIGVDGVLRLLGRSPRRGAEFVSAVSYRDSEGSADFTGRLRGSIAWSGRGTEGFGFDPIFVPEGAKATLAQMTPATKCQVSHRAKALGAMCEWLTTARGR